MTSVGPRILVYILKNDLDAKEGVELVWSLDGTD
jgi:hypothetical protein